MTTPQPSAPYYYGYPPQRPKRGRAPWIFLAVLVAAIAVAVVVIAAAGGFSSSKTTGVAKTFTVHGTFSINCVTDCVGYGDITQGAQVEVVDNSNQVLGVGYLTPNSTGTINSYMFTVSNIPTGKGLYGVHVGNVNRGVVWEQESQAASTGFVLSIG